MGRKQAIVIMCDTQRRDMLGAYYGDAVRTPNLDKLASEGVLFERAYCCDPVCGPARSAIFTGVYPHTNGIWSNGLALGSDIATIGQRLSRDGITCAYIGKWHIDGSLFGHGQAPDGWAPEWWFDARNYLESLDDEQRRTVRSDASSGKIPEDLCFAHRLGLYDKGPAAYEEITGVPLLIRKRGLTQPNTRYRKPVSHIDLTPTIIDAMGGDLSPVLEGQSMVPILEDPERPYPSDVFIEYGRFTMAHDGHGGFNPYRACVTEDYKLCINLLDRDELYCLKDDPDEMVNLIDAPAHAAVRNQLHDRILEWMNRTRDCFRGYHWERRPWRIDARPASYHYTGNKRYKRGDPGFTPEPLDYATGLPIDSYDQKAYS